MEPLSRQRLQNEARLHEPYLQRQEEAALGPKRGPTCESMSRASWWLPKRMLRGNAGEIQLGVEVGEGPSFGSLGRSEFLEKVLFKFIFKKFF